MKTVWIRTRFQVLIFALAIGLITLTMFVAATVEVDARGTSPQNDARAADALAPTPTPRARAPRAPNARTITFTYDNAGRVTEANYGSGTRVTFAYDFSGDLTTMQTFAVDLRIFFPVILK